MVDEIDRKILAILQKNARESNAQIGRELGLAPSGILERIRKLEKKGIIQGYSINLDLKKLGFGVTAFVFVKSSDRPGNSITGRMLAEIPYVEEVHHIAGDDCFLVKMRCASNLDLGKILREDFGAIESVESTRTSVVLNTLKDCGLLPLESEE